VEIASRIHHIQKAKGSHVYLLVDDDLTLIDASYLGNGNMIVGHIEGIDRLGEELERILITPAVRRN
jgi:hypothetical protein